jgi:acyl-CoA thioesterase-1
MRGEADRNAILKHSHRLVASAVTRWLAGIIVVVALISAMQGAAAADIVALGASNTAGFGVSRDQAFPSRLQAMLHAKGLNVSIANAGRSGDTVAGMLSRLGSAVPNGTRVVILDPGNNDIKACTETWRPQRCATPAEHDATVASIASRLQARGIKLVMANTEFRSVPISQWQADRRHLTAEGHRSTAARLLSAITDALGRGAP